MIAFLCILGGILVFIVIGMVVDNLRLGRLRRQRRGGDFGREPFIAAFRQDGIPDNVPAAVYDYYGSRGIWKDFPFSPGDRYSEVLCDDPEDLDCDARALVERLGMRLPPEYIRREWGDRPIQTLRDMVLWLDWIRRHQPATAEVSDPSPHRS